MNQYHSLIDHFRGQRPLINIVLDGYGFGKKDHTDAIFKAKTPVFDHLFQKYPSTTLATHGHHVGLPGLTDLGGSEVGHLTIGAGTIIPQGTTLINNSIKNGTFFKQPVLIKSMEYAKDNALHLIGLLSDGNIHSHLSHFIAVIQEAARRGIKRCYIHALLDGRDVGIQSADSYIQQIESEFIEIRKDQPHVEYMIASLGGREVITMDRDNNWSKIEQGWLTHVEGLSGNYFDDPMEGLQSFRDKNPGLIDQDCPPYNIRNKKGVVPRIEDGDSVIMMNFRADRSMEFAQAFDHADFDKFHIERKPDVFFASMMIYDEDTDLPKNRIIGRPNVANPFGKRILELGMNQFRLAETQKYAHVTFFFNGGYRNPLDPKKELYQLVESDKISSFAHAPQMKAKEITAKAIKLMESKKYDYGLINFANTDMVGHTGDFNAAKVAAETVDKALQEICKAVEKTGGIALITADHGNADEMIILNSKTGNEEACTRHSINPVPLIIYDPLFKQNFQLKPTTSDKALGLSMIAATNFILLGEKVPSDLDDPLFLI